MKIENIVRPGFVRALFEGANFDAALPMAARHLTAEAGRIITEEGEVDLVHLYENHKAGRHLWAAAVHEGGCRRYFGGGTLPLVSGITEAEYRKVLGRLPANIRQLVLAESLGLGWNGEWGWQAWESRGMFASAQPDGGFVLPEGIIRKDEAGMWRIAPHANRDKIPEGDLGRSPGECGWSLRTGRTFTGREYLWWEKEDSRREGRVLLVNGGELRWEFPLEQYRLLRVRVSHPLPQVTIYSPITPSPTPAGNDDFVEVSEEA